MSANELPFITLGDSGPGGDPPHRDWIAGPDGVQVCYVDELGVDAVNAAAYLRELVAAKLEALKNGGGT